MKAKVSEKRVRISLYLLALLVPLVVFSIGMIEHNSLYHPDVGDYPRNPLESFKGRHLEKLVQEVYFKTNDGVLLNGLYFPPQKGKPTVVFAHGNGGSMGDRYNAISAFTSNGYGFLAFDYRGYGKSKGYSTEEGLYEDFKSASEFLERKNHIPVSNQIALGESLGSAIAIDAGSKRPYRAVVAYSCMTTATDVAVHLRDTFQLGWLGVLPPELIVRQNYDALSKVGKVQSPVLLVQGEKDTMMPLWMAEKLYEKAGSAYKKHLIIKSAGHNTVMEYGSGQILDAVNQMIRETETVSALARTD